MANLNESATWEAGVYQLELTDPVVGGPGGSSNVQAQQLANRTAYLKGALESQGTALADHEAASDPHPQYLQDEDLQAHEAQQDPHPQYMTAEDVGNAFIAQGLHTIAIPAKALVPRQTSGAAIGEVEMEANKVPLYTLDFDALVTEYAAFEIPRMPASWDGGPLYFAPVWSHGSGATVYGVSWKCRLRSASDGEAIDQAYGAARESADVGGSANIQYHGPWSQAITPSGTPAGGECLRGEIYRDVAAAGDTLNVDARLHGLVLLYGVNAGSDT